MHTIVLCTIAVVGIGLIVQGASKCWWWCVRLSVTLGYIYMRNGVCDRVSEQVSVNLYLLCVFMRFRMFTHRPKHIRIECRFPKTVLSKRYWIKLIILFWGKQPVGGVSEFCVTYCFHCDDYDNHEYCCCFFRVLLCVFFDLQWEYDLLLESSCFIGFGIFGSVTIKRSIGSSFKTTIEDCLFSLNVACLRSCCYSIFHRPKHQEHLIYLL